MRAIYGVQQELGWTQACGLKWTNDDTNKECYARLTR